MLGLGACGAPEGVNAVRGLWVGLQASVGRVLYLCNIRTRRIQACSCYTVQRSRPVVGEVFRFSAHSLLNGILKFILQYDKCLKPCPWSVGAVGRAAAGQVAGARSKIEQTSEHRASRALSYEHQQRNVCILRLM